MLHDKIRHEVSNGSHVTMRRGEGGGSSADVFSDSAPVILREVAETLGSSHILLRRGRAVHHNGDRRAGRSRLRW